RRLSSLDHTEARSPWHLRLSRTRPAGVWSIAFLRLRRREWACGMRPLIPLRAPHTWAIEFLDTSAIAVVHLDHQEAVRHGVGDALLDAVLGHAAAGVKARAVTPLAAMHEFVHGDLLAQVVFVIAPGVPQDVFDHLVFRPGSEARDDVEPVVRQPPEI